MSALPAGTVTLLFTDIEGSTRLLQELGREPYMRALSDERRLLREAFAAHGGVEVEAQGDSFHFVFVQARDAVLAAVQAQRALAVHAWDTEAVRVRIGLHTGEPAPHEGLYAGIDVHRAARVMDAGHGGQILLSEVTAALVQDALPDDVELRDLGEHRLKDIAEPGRIHQLEVAGLRADFPPLRTLSPAAVKLPAPPTPIVGRRRERAEVRTLIDEGARLVTITGPGGVGKTRLALEIAHELSGRFPDGVYFVALAPVQDHALVLPSIARTFELEDVVDLTPLEALVRHLREKALLLVLDNLEQVVEAAPGIGELVATARGLVVIATSRQPLHLSGEHDYGLDPLELPGADVAEPEALERIDSVALFLERARAAGQRLQLDRDGAAIAAICRRLDGLPLALELAAARLRLLPPSELLARLEQSLPLLVGGPADAPQRQRTIRAAIDWSHELLSERERTRLRRVSVFVGGCTLEAVEQVCDADFDALETLAEASLVRVVDAAGGGRRFSTLRVIREYAAERLEESGEAGALHGRLVAYLLDLARDADTRMRGAEQAEQLERVTAELDNMRAALGWALDHEPEQALQLASALQRYFYVRGYSGEGLRALEEALARKPDAEPSLRARALRSAGTLADGIGDFARARPYLEESIALLRGLDSPRDLAVALNNAGAVAVHQADLDGARGFLSESLELKRAIGDRHGTAMSLSNLAMLETKAGNLDAASALQEEALELFRELGDESALTNALIALAEVAVLQRDGERVRSLIDEALPHTERVGDRAATIEALCLLARSSVDEADVGAALAHVARAAELAAGLDDAYTAIIALEAAAEVFRASAELAHAVTLRAAVARARSESDAREWPTEHRQVTEELLRTRELLGDAEYERAWSEGSAMSPQDALAATAVLAAPPNGCAG